MSPRWAAFLDRDGTLVDEVGLISRPEDIRLLPGAADAVKRIRAAGGLAIVVTNQPVVARGLLTEEGLKKVHDRFEKLLADEGARLDALYYCPHHPETTHPEANDPKYRRACDCRKPAVGMLQEAAKRFDIDVAASFMVGDTTRDVQTAKNAGCRGILVGTGYAGKDAVFSVRPDAVVADIAAAADWILSKVGAKA